MSIWNDDEGGFGSLGNGELAILAGFALVAMVLFVVWPR